MFGILKRFFSTQIEKTSQIQAKKMPRTRYFPNTMPDYTGGEIIIPKDFVPKRVQKLVGDIEKHIKPVPKHAADGLYLGTAGIAYMYLHLSKIPSFDNQKESLLQKASEYIASAIDGLKCVPFGQRDEASFILGDCGVYAVAATIYHSVGDDRLADVFEKSFWEASQIMKKRDFRSCGSDELFVGRAGSIIGALWLSKELNKDLNKDMIYKLCDVMFESGKRYAHNCKSPCPLMYAYYECEYLGAAHGLCAILQAFLSVPGYLELRAESAQVIKNAVDFVLALQDIEGNFPSAMDEVGNTCNELVHWCHGAAGMIYLMGKAHLVWKEQKYLKSCLKMGDLIWEKGLLKKGPGICHGVAGNGYAFLLLHRLTNDPKHLHRAYAFATFMESEEFRTGSRTPDYPYSLYEGVAGTACFLGDLSNPSGAVFPFSDVF